MQPWYVYCNNKVVYSTLASDLQDAYERFYNNRIEEWETIIQNKDQYYLLESQEKSKYPFNQLEDLNEKLAKK